MRDISNLNKKFDDDYYTWKNKNDRIQNYQYRIKNYGGKYFKLIVLKTNIDYKRIDRENIINNEDKLENNLIRAKNRVFELAMCNSWDWFVTLSLNEQKYDRFNLKEYIKDLSIFIRSQRKRKNVDFKYLFVPEPHKDGAWHIHGMLKGVVERDMPKFTIYDNVKYDLVKGGYHNWLPYQKKFGFVSLGKVKNEIAVSKYCSKYINKTLIESSLDLGVHTYYASQGLNDCGDSIELNPSVVSNVVNLKSLYDSDFCDLYELTQEQANEMLKKYGGSDE